MLYLLLDRQVNAKQQHAYTHGIKRITSEAGVQNESQLRVRFDPSYQTLEFHSLKIRRGDAVLDRLDRSKIKVIQQETQLDWPIYNGDQAALIFLDDVRVGDVIDYSFSQS